MKVYIEREDRYVAFKTDNGQIVYDILINNLGDSNNYPEGQISEYIYNIAPKSWATRELVEELCDIIQKEHPTNDIDWVATKVYIDSFL